MATYKPYRKTDSAGTLEEIKIPYSSVDGTPTIPTKVSQLTNDSGFTTNTGTITGIKMNGASKGTSGVVDLGTVITAHQDISGLMPKSGGTFTGEVKFGNTENFQGYYIKRMIGSLGAGTAYANLSSSYKDGTWHRMWRLRFPSGSSFWGKIKITLYGGYSSFNASGVMSKSITCNFNTSNIYNNVGCYDGLGVNVEQDFRISEAIWNATASAWEVLIWQKNLSGNNSPVIMLECWTTNNTNYIKAFKGIAAQTVELTQSTSYSAQKASSTGGTKTVMWATLPVYENPLGEEIATVAMLDDKQDKLTVGSNISISGNTISATVPTKTSQLTNDSGFLTSHQDISGKANLNGGNTFTGKQTLTSPPADGYSINASGYVKGSWLQAPSTGKSGSNTGKVCVLDNAGWVYYRTPAEIVSDGGGATTSQIPDISGKLDKTTYEENKTIDFGSTGVLKIGKFKVYDTNVSCEITSTTSLTYSGKLVIACQNNIIMKMTVYGDAANTIAPNIFVKPSTTSDPYIEVYFKPSSWSKNVIHIYGSGIQEAPTGVCTNVSAVPSTATQKPINALTDTFAQKSNIPTKTSQLTNDSGYTTNKGTVTQVKINGTTKSPNSAGLVDLGTISGGGDNPLSTIELVAGDSIQVASPSAEGASYVKIIGNSDLGQAKTLEIDVFITTPTTTTSIFHKAITLDVSYKSVICLEIVSVNYSAYAEFIIKLSYGGVVETKDVSSNFGFDNINGVGFSYEDQANQSSIFTGIMIKEVEP